MFVCHTNNLQILREATKSHTNLDTKTLKLEKKPYLSLPRSIHYEPLSADNENTGIGSVVSNISSTVSEEEVKVLPAMPNDRKSFSQEIINLSEKLSHRILKFQK